MSLLERYLHEVERQLPRKQRTDIVAELRETLRAQVEAEESARGRRLRDDEAAAILLRYGKPSIVAARYGAPRYLIGPDVYPSYIFSVKLVLWIMAPFAALAIGAQISSSDGTSIAARLIEPTWHMALILLSNLFLITMIFAWGERRAVQPAAVERWDPRDLPPLPERGDPIPRGDVVSNLVTTGLTLLWWQGVNAAIWRWFGGEPTSFEWLPIFDAVTPAVLALIGASVAREMVGLLRPSWVQFYLGAGVLLDLLALPVLLKLLLAGQWLTVSDSSSPGAVHVGFLNFGAFVALLVLTIVVAADAVWDAWRLYRRQRTVIAG